MPPLLFSFSFASSILSSRENWVADIGSVVEYVTVPEFVPR
jgi:hypothetical protein